MPYKDNAVRLVHARTYSRNMAHPHWRQIAYMQGFVCLNAGDNFEDCEVSYNLEFHHCSSDSENVDRHMICRVCHWHEHNNDGHPFPLERGKVSMVIGDLDFEMYKEGGLQAWKEKYGIVSEAEWCVRFGLTISA